MKRIKRRKAFTLVELLAVIIIIGIISLIAVPLIGKIVDNHRFQTAEISALEYIDIANAYAAKNLFGNNGGITVDEEKYIYETFKDDEVLNKLNYRGVVPSYVRLEYDIVTNTILEARMCISDYSIYYFDGRVSKGEMDYCHDVDTISPVVTVALRKNVATINITDEGSGVSGYCILSNTKVSLCNWLSTNGENITNEFSGMGTYYIYGIDRIGNISTPYELVITKSSFCEYEEGHEFEFTYKGSPEEWEVPCDGKYKIAVWGAKGGDAYYRPWADCCGCIWNGSTGSATNGYSLAATYHLAYEDILKFVVGGNGGTGMNVDVCWDGTQAQTGGGGYNGGRGGVSGGSGSGGGTDVYLGDTRILGAHGGSGFLQGYGDYRQNEVGGGGSNYINSSISNYVATDAGASKNSTGGKVVVTLLELE